MDVDEAWAKFKKGGDSDAVKKASVSEKLDYIAAQLNELNTDAKRTMEATQRAESEASEAASAPPAPAMPPAPDASAAPADEQGTPAAPSADTAAPAPSDEAAGGEAPDAGAPPAPGAGESPSGGDQLTDEDIQRILDELDNQSDEEGSDEEGKDETAEPEGEGAEPAYDILDKLKMFLKKLAHKAIDAGEPDDVAKLAELGKAADGIWSVDDKNEDEGDTDGADAEPDEYDKTGTGMNLDQNNLVKSDSMKKSDTMAETKKTETVTEPVAKTAEPPVAKADGPAPQEPKDVAPVAASANGAGEAKEAEGESKEAEGEKSEDKARSLIEQGIALIKQGQAMLGNAEGIEEEGEDAEAEGESEEGGDEPDVEFGDEGAEAEGDGKSEDDEDKPSDANDELTGKNKTVEACNGADQKPVRKSAETMSMKELMAARRKGYTIAGGLSE